VGLHVRKTFAAPESSHGIINAVAPDELSSHIAADGMTWLRLVWMWHVAADPLADCFRFSLQMWPQMPKLIAKSGLISHTCRCLIWSHLTFPSFPVAAKRIMNDDASRWTLMEPMLDPAAPHPGLISAPAQTTGFVHTDSGFVSQCCR
jgi:hypothetical protein